MRPAASDVRWAASNETRPGAPLLRRLGEGTYPRCMRNHADGRCKSRSVKHRAGSVTFRTAWRRMVSGQRLSLASNGSGDLEKASPAADPDSVRESWERLLPHATRPGSYVDFMTEYETDRVRASGMNRDSTAACSLPMGGTRAAPFRGAPLAVAAKGAGENALQACRLVAAAAHPVALAHLRVSQVPGGRPVRLCPRWRPTSEQAGPAAAEHSQAQESNPGRSPSSSGPWLEHGRPPLASLS